MPTSRAPPSRLAVALLGCALATTAAAEVPAVLAGQSAAAGEPATAPPPPAAAPAPAPGPPGHAGWKRRFAALAGWGYYEVTHAGVSYQVDDRAAFSAFGGYGAAGDQTTWTAGAAFAHALFGPIWTLQPGWDLKAISWARSDPSYEWKIMTLVLGAYLARDLGPRLRLALDGGVGLSWALQSDRTQDFTYGSPTRWNGSVCLEISYRLGGP